MSSESSCAQPPCLQGPLCNESPLLCRCRYLKAITVVNNLWMSTDGNAAFPAASTLGFGRGRAWWIGLCGGAGAVVGLTKALL